MQNISNKESEQSSIHSTSPRIVSLPSLWNSTGNQIPLSSLSNNLNLSLDSQTLHYHNAKHLRLQPQDQESSSTQSTAQSHHIVAGMEGGNRQGKCASAHSGYGETYQKQNDKHAKSVLSLGTTNFIYPPSQVDFNQPVTHIPFAFTDPYLCGALAAYGPQAIIHPQILGVAPGRVPLPLNVAEELIYVNAKQYHGIIRRRQIRAKLEAQNKLTKRRKPYLHESRHLHAMRRARGSGGRFLDTKKLQQSKVTAANINQNVAGSSLLQLGALDSDVLQSENSSIGGATFSDITSASNNNDIFRQSDLGFSGFHTHMGRMQGSSAGDHIMRNGSRHPVSVVQ